MDPVATASHRSRHSVNLLVMRVQWITGSYSLRQLLQLRWGEYPNLIIQGWAEPYRRRKHTSRFRKSCLQRPRGSVYPQTLIHSLLPTLGHLSRFSREGPHNKSSGNLSGENVSTGPTLVPDDTGLTIECSGVLAIEGVLLHRRTSRLMAPGKRCSQNRN